MNICITQRYSKMSDNKLYRLYNFGEGNKGFTAIGFDEWKAKLLEDEKDGSLDATHIWLDDNNSDIAKGI